MIEENFNLLNSVRGLDRNRACIKQKQHPVQFGHFSWITTGFFKTLARILLQLFAVAGTCKSISMLEVNKKI